MVNLIRCKACGYVTETGRIKDVCPACGVPAKMFEPFTDPVSDKRRRLLGLHIHPILVHFPQAFAVSLFFLAVLSFGVSTEINISFRYTMSVISFFLPLVIFLAVLSGLLDAKIRFRKVTTIFLKMKIIIGSVFFIVSIAMATIAFFGQFWKVTIPFYFIGLAIIATACGIALGLIGGKLRDAKFPG
jgi:hypothetical protein